MSKGLSFFSLQMQESMWFVKGRLGLGFTSFGKERLVFLRLKFCAFLSFEYWVLESCEFLVWGLSVIEC